jgi:hypothetical protein
VRHGHGGLQEQKAAARIGRFNPPAACITSNCPVISQGVVSAQRQLKAAFARECAVARAGAAPQFGQYRLHIVSETAGDV